MKRPPVDAANDAEPDIVAIILKQIDARIPGGVPPELAQLIEADIRQLYGGLRVRIPKRRKHLTEAERALLFGDGISNLTNREILLKHKISLRTLERQMKRGPGRFGE